MDKAVSIGGQMVKTFTGFWDSLPSMKIFEETTFTPTFFVDAVLKTKTGLQLGFRASMEFLKASLSMSAFNYSVGPLFEKKFAYDPAFMALSLYDGSFNVGGFNKWLGQAFTLTPTAKTTLPELPKIPHLGPKKPKCMFGFCIKISAFAAQSASVASLESFDAISTPAPVPLPAAVWMLLAALGWLGTMRRVGSRAKGRAADRHLARA